MEVVSGAPIAFSASWLSGFQIEFLFFLIHFVHTVQNQSGEFLTELTELSIMEELGSAPDSGVASGDSPEDFPDPVESSWLPGFQIEFLFSCFADSPPIFLASCPPEADPD
jgi:hypothetical protein